jgi:uncharacterized protein (TIGR02996 family)
MARTSYPINRALEAAVAAHADDDTPRLAYADWLDENDDPDRAEFIRVQCRLADLSPAEADWINLTERQEELVARLKHRFPPADLDRAKRFYFGTDIISAHEEPYRRGFPYFIACQMRGAEWTREGTARVVSELTRLVRTTAIRGFHPYEIPAGPLVELLTSPASAELRGLAVRPLAVTNSYEEEYVSFYRALATCPALRGVQHLFLYGSVPVGGVELLAKAKNLAGVRRMTLQGLSGSKSSLQKLTRAAWFKGLHHLRIGLGEPSIAKALLSGIGSLPKLQSLDLPDLWKGAVRELASGQFRSLARLLYEGPLDVASAKVLARGRFPRLVAVVANRRGMKNDAFETLIRGDWFAQLRLAAFDDNRIGDRGVAALAAHPVAKSLRVLRLGDNAFAKTGLEAIANPGAFQALTTLDIGSYLKRKGTAADLSRFVASLQLPCLRHLNLKGWPLGDAGAKALAANAALAGLTRLDLSSCRIGDEGARALVASPHLQNLVELQMNYNAIKTGADDLADPKVMPRLGVLWLSSNRIPEKLAAKFKRPGLYAII